MIRGWQPLPNMDNIMCWNIRGLNRKTKQIEVRKVLQDHNIKLLGLLETKVRAHALGGLYLTICPWWCITSNLPWNGRGRIVVVWDPLCFTVDILLCTDQLVHCKVKPTHGNSFLCTIVYAHNDRRLRENLWKNLCEVLANQPGSWMVMGDFNTMLEIDERIGSNITSGEIAPFRSCVDICGLTDVKYIGRQYTWTNKQSNESRVLSKLDRILANKEWINDYNSAEVTFLPEGYIDHSPGVIKCYKLANGRKPFRFFQMWSSSPKFKEVVKEVW